MDTNKEIPNELQEYIFFLNLYNISLQSPRNALLIISLLSNIGALTQYNQLFEKPTSRGYLLVLQKILKGLLHN